MADLSMPQQGRSEPASPERTRGGFYFTPRVDIYETEKELTLYADLPGVRPQDVDLRYEQGELLLLGKVTPRTEKNNSLVQEYGVGNFYRVFSIHESIDSSRITAECKNGVLTVHLPKMEQARPRQINIQVT